MYPWSSSGFGTKYSDPTSLPIFWTYGGCVFSPDGTDLAMAHAFNPSVTTYPWSSSGFGSKYSNPPDGGNGNSGAVAFSPDGAAIAVGHFSSNYISVYPWDSGYGTKYSDPSYLPPDGVRGIAFSPA